MSDSYGKNANQEFDSFNDMSDSYFEYTILPFIEGLIRGRKIKRERAEQLHELINEATEPAK